MTPPQHPAPYPVIQATQSNPEYAKLMLSNMGGVDSEMSAVSLYFYNHLVSWQDDPLSRMFHSLSITEMRHLEIFGRLALQLGADPRLWESRRRGKSVYWSPDYNRYSTKPKKLISNALYAEYMSIERYGRQAKLIQDENVVENLRRIIRDEQAHVQILKEALIRYA